MRSEPVPQPRGVDEPGQGVVRGRVAVDPPGEPVVLQTVEQRLGGVVGDERLRWTQVHHVTRRGAGVEERTVGEGA